MRNDKFSYGITILIFGLIYLLDRLDILAKIPHGSAIMSISWFFLIAGLVFIFTQPKRALGWLFAAIGIFLNANLFFGWMQSYSEYMVPIALISAGAIMVLSSKKK